MDALPQGRRHRAGHDGSRTSGGQAAPSVLLNDHQEGLERGRKEGLKEGLEKGLAQGREEERLRTARAMMAKGYRPEEIAELLSMDIETLRHQ